MMLSWQTSGTIHQMVNDTLFDYAARIHFNGDEMNTAVDGAWVHPMVTIVKITDVTQVPVSPNPHHVDARKVYDSEYATAVVITLKPGETLKKHSTPVDVFFYVLEGEGVVEIGSERAEVGENRVVESPARIPHRWMNESVNLFRVLVVKVPRPQEETKIL